MKEEYYIIKDKCRAGLLKYLEEAAKLLPAMKDPGILDIGCGTGVPALWLAGKYGGNITAADTDKNALHWLNKKIINESPGNNITVRDISFTDLAKEQPVFDIIIAEGLLNITGFRQGFEIVLPMLKKGGWFIIHDEYKDHEMKCEIIKENYCDLEGTLSLDESIWWNDYYRQLEEDINKPENRPLRDLFVSDLKEIECYKNDPSPFRSIYYVVKKRL